MSEVPSPTSTTGVSAGILGCCQGQQGLLNVVGGHSIALFAHAKVTLTDPHTNSPEVVLKKTPTIMDHQHLTPEHPSRKVFIPSVLEERFFSCSIFITFYLGCGKVSSCVNGLPGWPLSYGTQAKITSVLLSPLYYSVHNARHLLLGALKQED